jgi:two-component system, sensor histidine kinase
MFRGLRRRVLMSLPEFLFERVTADIRQQMDGVLAMVGQLNRTRLNPDAEACVASVAEAAESVRRVLDGARDLQSIGAEGVGLNLAPVPFRDLIDALQDRWQARAAQAGVTLLVSYDGDPDAAAMMDRTRMLQVFDGFIGEAVGGQRRGSVEASLKVVATAERIDLEGRIRGGRDSDWRGQGYETRIAAIANRLGLEAAIEAMLARQLVGCMGGRFALESHVGDAETVCFELALEPVTEEAAAPEAAASRAIHILVVDDNATNRMVAQSLVEMFECTSEAAEDGFEAVEFARSGRFDLILMDIKMPRMDGVEATRAIRAMPPGIGDIPIIALTANADPEDAAGYLAAGMNGVVEKPMKPEHLLNA